MIIPSWRRDQYLYYVSHPLKDCSFHCLTSFSINCDDYTSKGSEPFDSLLKFLVFGCPALVNLALTIFASRPISCMYVVKNAAWSSLEKLTLVGPLTFFENDTSLDESMHLYLFFFGRHPRLERLYLRNFEDTNGFMERFSSELGWRLPDVFPSLRSLGLDCSISSRVLSRLVHISNNLVLPYDYSWAQSLRSCILGEANLDHIETLVRNAPQLERLSLTFDARNYINMENEPFREEFPALITELQNLTHLEIHVKNIELENMCRAEDFIEQLPRLSYIRVWSGTQKVEWILVTTDPEDNTYQVTSMEDSLDQSFMSEFWGDFFAGPTMELEVENRSLSQHCE